jgi:polyhydroxyalkanoate synthesis regulator protein
MNAEGIPPAYLEKAMQRFTDYKNDIEQNLQPIYFTDQTYTSGSKSILTVVETKMAINPTEQAEALLAASNYIKTEILDFEADYKEANNGKKPKPEDRRKFITELSNWVITNYANDASVMPTDLVSMDDKKQNEEDLDNLRTTLDVTNVLTNVNEALTNLNTIEGFGEQSEFKDFIPFNQPDRVEFYENTFNPQIDKAIGSVFPEGVLTKELIEAFTTEELNRLVLNLANQLNVDTSFIRKSMQRLTGAS